jgi:SOS-response transcriptional repressor LexA
MSLERLTDKQRDILEYIISCFVKELRFPTYRAMCAHFEVASTNAITSHIRHIMRKGWIRQADGVDCGFVFTEETMKHYGIKVVVGVDACVYPEIVGSHDLQVKINRVKSACSKAMIITATNDDVKIFARTIMGMLSD